MSVFAEEYFLVLSRLSSDDRCCQRHSCVDGNGKGIRAAESIASDRVFLVFEKRSRNSYGSDLSQ
eukprot:3620048-Rhodomonas_salina.1